MFEVVLILILIMVNGFFAAAEMAFVTARPARLRGLADSGNAAARRVLATKEQSGDFLAMVQVGITLVATLASAVGGAATARSLAPLLEPLAGAYAEQVALGIIVIVISYATLVVGELVPKQLALQNAEGFAMLVVRPLNWLQRVLWLPIRVLDYSANGILRLMGGKREQSEIESAEEITLIVQQAALDGVIDQQEENLITNIFDYAEANLADIMTARPNIVFLEHTQTVGDVRQLAQESGFSRFIVTKDELDNFVGYVHVKDLLIAEKNRPIANYVREAHLLPETLDLPTAFTRLTKIASHLAIVLDEFGSVSGIVTLEDMLEEIVGEIEDEYSADQAMELESIDGEWQLDGATSLLDVKNIIGVELPETSDFNTLAGFFMHQFGAIPEVGDTVAESGHQFRVVKMDERRVAQIEITVLE